MSTRSQPVTITHDDGTRTDADLTVPHDPVGVVVFAHGSGSGRHSPRNKMVASALNDRGLATLLLDLLTPSEEAEERLGATKRFDVELMAERLATSASALRGDAALGAQPIGYFGASTGAAAALIAAASHPEGVAAIVSRGGRPDLAGRHLSAVRVPTLLVVGGNDGPVIELNRRARAQLCGPSELVIIPGATHLFEEPGTLEQVAVRAGDWFAVHLQAVRSHRCVDD